MQKRDFETYQKRFRDFEILPNFPRPTFFEVPFETPNIVRLSGQQKSLSVKGLNPGVISIYCIKYVVPGPAGFTVCDVDFDKKIRFSYKRNLPSVY